MAETSGFRNLFVLSSCVNIYRSCLIIYIHSLLHAYVYVSHIWSLDRELSAGCV